MDAGICTVTDTDDLCAGLAFPKYITVITLLLPLANHKRPSDAEVAKQSAPKNVAAGNEAQILCRIGRSLERSFRIDVRKLREIHILRDSAWHSMLLW